MRGSGRYAVGSIEEGSAVLRYSEVAGERVLRMEPRARGVDYGSVATGANAAMDREMRLAHNKKCVGSDQHYKCCTNLRQHAFAGSCSVHVSPALRPCRECKTGAANCWLNEFHGCR